jgi:hypothetical protein
VLQEELLMAVYVDWLSPCVPNARWRYSQSCHLMADSIEELHKFALEKLGLKITWFQNHASHPHYDLTPGKRAQAVKLGAVEVDMEYYRRKRADLKVQM